MNKIFVVILLAISSQAIAAPCVMKNDIVQCKTVEGSVAAAKILMAGGAGVGMPDTESNSPPGHQPGSSGGRTTTANDRPAKGIRTALNAHPETAKKRPVGATSLQ